MKSGAHFLFTQGPLSLTLAQLRPQQKRRYQRALHNQSARKWAWHKMQLRLTALNRGMHKVNKAKQKPSNEIHAATSRQALITVKKEFGFHGPRLCESI